MGYLFFDDSKHALRGFSLGVFVYSSEDLTILINDALTRCGLEPRVEEFKSSGFMNENSHLVKLRKELRFLLCQYCQLGVVVVPNDSELGPGSLALLSKMTKHPTLRGNEHEVFFDQGIFSSTAKAQQIGHTMAQFENCKLYFEQDSKMVAGIQIADMAAHTCAVMLCETLGVIDKTVKAGENSGYEPDLNISLGFELWAGIRYSFLSEPPPQPEEWSKGELQPMANVEPYGLHISKTANQELRTAANKRFGTMYWGCIH